jgi:ubiquinone biosynthesis protein Coq4
MKKILTLSEKRSGEQDFKKFYNNLAKLVKLTEAAKEAQFIGDAILFFSNSDNGAKLLKDTKIRYESQKKKKPDESLFYYVSITPMNANDIKEYVGTVFTHSEWFKNVYQVFSALDRNEEIEDCIAFFSKNPEAAKYIEKFWVHERSISVSNSADRINSHGE